MGGPLVDAARDDKTFRFDRRQGALCQCERRVDVEQVGGVVDADVVRPPGGVPPAGLLDGLDAHGVDKALFAAAARTSR